MESGFVTDRLLKPDTKPRNRRLGSRVEKDKIKHRKQVDVNNNK